MRVYKNNYVDISKTRYFNLTAIQYVKTIDGRAIWEFLCDCGKKIEIQSKSVKTGNTKSCGCRKLIRGPKNLKGKRFGYLIAIRCIGKKHDENQYWWKCKCDCGNFSEVKSAWLSAGRVKSCGCLMSETVIRLNKQRSGPNHPSWRSDISIEEKKRRKSERKYSDPRLNRWRTKVYERDNYTCQKCKDASGGNLIGHHIYSWAYYKKLRYVTENGITLCQNCHKDFHKQFGKKRNTQKQLTEWIKYEIKTKI